MDIKEITQELQKKYKAFIQEIKSMNEHEFMKAASGKWSAGQQLEHLCRSIRPLSLGLQLPKFVPKLIFGKANRRSKSYDKLVQKYLSKLAEGTKTPTIYEPSKIVPISRRTALCTRLQRLVNTLIRVLKNYNEYELDQLILIHPLIGKITVREMMYFTIYHAKHHHQAVLVNLD